MISGSFSFDPATLPSFLELDRLKADPDQEYSVLNRPPETQDQDLPALRPGRPRGASPKAEALITDKGYGSDGFRAALEARATLHSVNEKQEDRHQLRTGTLTQAPQSRESLRQTKLAANRTRYHGCAHAIDKR
ncbi:hypothetical protein [Methylocystis sp. SB2]|uniref:hypothetical protein n=1 Tax=Methylocystis sp. (strain SB2) TaxID=743836 RepID=UPI000407AB07|nr:hypothetical protein [Methylocystis sp. SB2]ULO25081.1 hypothetical protein LNB28_06750 [Methylocystis sp. SB2]